MIRKVVSMSGHKIVAGCRPQERDLSVGIIAHLPGRVTSNLGGAIYGRSCSLPAEDGIDWLAAQGNARVSPAALR